MQTHFSTWRSLADSDTVEANKILRKCVHCGFCNATCPTFLLLNDELDGPRGRIYLMKDMLETGKPATAEAVRHIDRCLSCLSCMTTCPSGVNPICISSIRAAADIEETLSPPVRRAPAAPISSPRPCPPAGRFRRFPRAALGRLAGPLLRASSGAARR